MESEEKIYNMETRQWEEKKAEDKPEVEKQPENKEGGENPNQGAEKKQESETKIDETTKKPDERTNTDPKLAEFEEKIKLKDSELSNSQNRIKELEEEAKKPREVEFASEQDKKAYEFIRQYPPSQMGDALRTYSQLFNMDVDNASVDTVLKEEYISRHKSLPREKAEKLFASHMKQYTLNRDNFESDEDFKEAQELADIKKEQDAIEARGKLKTLVSDLKPKEPAKETAKAEEPIAPAESVKFYNNQIDQFFKGKDGKAFDTLTFTDKTDPKISYNAKVDPELLKKAQIAMKEHLNDASLYDENKKIPNFDPQFMFRQFLFLVDPDAYDRMHTEKVTNLARTMTAEQVASTNPDKVSKVAADGEPVDITDQFRALGRKAAEERQKAGKPSV